MNIKDIKELVKMLDGTDIAEFNFECEGTRLTIKKSSANNQTQIIPSYHQAVALPLNQPQVALANQAPVVQNVPAAVETTVETNDEGLATNQVMVSAPMVGTFYRSSSPDAEPYIQVGQNVEVGQVLCIIEAMKLMNEIEAEWRGKVVNIMVENAQAVEYGQPLFIIEKL